MKAYVYPGDEYGCGYYRLIWPALAAAGQGHDVTVVMPSDRRVLVQVTPDGRPFAEKFPDDADVVVLQRPTHQYLAAVVPMLRRRGVAVVIDMDDDLEHIDAQNRAFQSLAKNMRWGNQVAPNPHSRRACARACRDATLVTVSTPVLAEVYGAHGRRHVLPNCVPARYLEVPHEDSDTIGWGGVVVVHPHDLQAVGPAIARLVAEGYRFETVGEPAGVGRALGLREDPPSPGDVDLDTWPSAIARFGIGIAPLATSRFNAAKSWLKALEYTAVGVPWVGSALPEYERLNRLGVGAIADKPKVWRARLLDLLASPELRAEQSAAGRALAADLTIEGNAWRWAEAWAFAVQLHREAAATPVG